MSDPRTVSPARARRIALAAQGFAQARPSQVTARQINAVIGRLAQFQIDSINVVERAHYLPVFSRLGGYDKALLDRAFGHQPRRLFEYWGHAASLIDITLEPSLRWRMAAHAQRPWAELDRINADHPGLVELVRAEVADRGPVTARQIEHDETRDRSHWGWNWSSVKSILEWMLWTGQMASARRNTQFERCYDLPERVIPPAVLDSPTPSAAEAHIQLVRRAAQALGIASVACLSDYFRTKSEPTRRAIDHLARTGELVAVRVPGWPAHWMWHQARAPRQVAARALVCPFDPLIFERNRALRIFGLNYRIEVYVPAAKRRYGYYVYPFLLGETFAARVDLKADRAAGSLIVKSAWREPGVLDPGHVARELTMELRALADWLRLSDVRPARGIAGDLAPDLLQALG